MRQFDVTDPVRLANTGAADLWRVTLKSGAAGVLKHYPRGHMGNEAKGALYLSRARELAVPVFDQSEDALVMGWLGGPSLGDHTRRAEAGHFDACLAEADMTLARMAADLQGCAIDVAGLLPLRVVFQAFLAAQLPEGRLKDAQSIAHHCFQRAASQPEVALHGDLHPENLLWDETQWRVIDAKGLRGPAVFELANAFRHPKGADLVNGARIEARLLLWSGALDVARDDLLRWAIAKAGLSQFWSSAQQSITVQGSGRKTGQRDVLTALLSHR